MPESIPTRFENTFGLAELPYFEVRDERLVIADDSLGPIADVHTHLALSYVRHETVDLRASSVCARHYLPLERPLDIAAYANLNFVEEDLKNMKRDLTVGTLRKEGMRGTHTSVNLLREMEELQVAKSVLLPIDFPVFSKNAETYLGEAREFEGLETLASVHPMARNKAEQLEAQKAAGALGLKVHPAVQGVKPDHPNAMELYRIAADLELPVLWHCGPVGIELERARERCQLKYYWPAIHENPDTIFILGHSGALQWEMALELSKAYSNVIMDTSCQGLDAVARILDESPEDRIMHGSDWPFYHQAMSIAKVLLVTEDRPELRRRVLWENAARLFGW